mmetsp:Transcript_31760/g.64746  ORF Transcript_31760/g.64746 Transcript_31760/m.64746 type:complete len:214 (+) Transcript_31760:920-1561(+)
MATATTDGRWTTARRRKRKTRNFPATAVRAFDRTTAPARRSDRWPPLCRRRRRGDLQTPTVAGPRKLDPRLPRLLPPPPRPPPQMRRRRRRRHPPRQTQTLPPIPLVQRRRLPPLHLRRHLRRGQIRQTPLGRLHRPGLLRRRSLRVGRRETKAPLPMVFGGAGTKRDDRPRRSAGDVGVEHPRRGGQTLGLVPASRSQERRQGTAAHAAGGG